MSALLASSICKVALLIRMSCPLQIMDFYFVMSFCPGFPGPGNSTWFVGTDACKTLLGVPAAADVGLVKPNLFHGLLSVPVILPNVR